MWLLFVMLFILLAGISSIIAIYIKTKKTSGNGEIADSRTKNKEKQGELRSLFDITNILEDGTICIGENTYTRIYYFSTPDFSLLSESEQQFFENDLITIVRSIDIPVQLFTTVQRVEIAGYIDMLDNVINNIETPETIKRYTKALKDRLEYMRTSDEFFVRKDYIILSVAEQRQDIALDKLNLEEKKLFQLFKRASIRVYQLDRISVLQLLRDQLRRGNSLLLSKAVKSGALATIITGRGIIADEVEDKEQGIQQEYQSAGTA